LQMLVQQLKMLVHQKLRNSSVFAISSTIENTLLQLFVLSTWQMFVRTRDCNVLANNSSSLMTWNSNLPQRNFIPPKLQVFKFTSVGAQFLQLKQRSFPDWLFRVLQWCKCWSQ
jgi:hypothetical protein